MIEPKPTEHDRLTQINIETMLAVRPLGIAD